MIGRVARTRVLRSVCDEANGRRRKGNTGGPSRIANRQGQQLIVARLVPDGEGKK